MSDIQLSFSRNYKFYTNKLDNMILVNMVGYLKFRMCWFVNLSKINISKLNHLT